jgi:hypothetical protein
VHWLPSTTQKGADLGQMLPRLAPAKPILFPALRFNDIQDKNTRKIRNLTYVQLRINLHSAT